VGPGFSVTLIAPSVVQLSVAFHFWVPPCPQSASAGFAVTVNVTTGARRARSRYGWRRRGGQCAGARSGRSRHRTRRRLPAGTARPIRPCRLAGAPGARNHALGTWAPGFRSEDPRPQTRRRIPCPRGFQRAVCQSRSPGHCLTVVACSTGRWNPASPVLPSTASPQGDAGWTASRSPRW
jgi:hypothetical protein